MLFSPEAPKYDPSSVYGGGVIGHKVVGER